MHHHAPADALLFVAPGCPHCPAVLDALAGLVKEGAIGRLEVVSLAVHPEAAEALGVRSVPWFRIGLFEFAGAMPAGELRQWAQSAAEGGGRAPYYAYLLANRRMDRVLELITQQPEGLIELLQWLELPGTPLGVHIGVGALLEELQGSPLLRGAVTAIAALSRVDSPRLRADACHYLGLTGAPEALPPLRERLDDPDLQVREIAMESIALIEATPA